MQNLVDDLRSRGVLHSSRCIAAFRAMDRADFFRRICPIDPI